MTKGVEEFLQEISWNRLLSTNARLRLQAKASTVRIPSYLRSGENFSKWLTGTAKRIAYPFPSGRAQPQTLYQQLLKLDAFATFLAPPVLSEVRMWLLVFAEVEGEKREYARGRTRAGTSPAVHVERLHHLSKSYKFFQSQLRALNRSGAQADVSHIGGFLKAIQAQAERESAFIYPLGPSVFVRHSELRWSREKEELARTLFTVFDRPYQQRNRTKDRPRGFLSTVYHLIALLITPPHRLAAATSEIESPRNIERLIGRSKR